MTINKNQPTSYDFVFPVFGGDLNDKKQFVPKQIYGTAFYISNNIYITCGHTIQSASFHEITALGYQNSFGTLSFVKIVNSEIFEDNDSGLIVAKIDRATPMPWLKQKLAMLNDVVSSGYPYGFDDSNAEILIRSYKGYISLVGYYNRFPKKPAHYELSYMCPRGLSGGPLIFVYQNQGHIVGMTIGNEMTDMIVSSFTETDETDKMKIVYEKVEALHRGIAVQTESFFYLNSRILGMTFIDYLTENNLIK